MKIIPRTTYWLTLWFCFKIQSCLSERVPRGRPRGGADESRTPEVDDVLARADRREARPAGHHHRLLVGHALQFRAQTVSSFKFQI